ncbi:rod shape-determining protein MreC, partial [Sandaracinobacter sp. RS1-74]|uniref:rod shape-determining protein MreC n=1 Tax=Sandaracinobacteroides sayramensis TaxID=2913411 RepID=UPI001EDA88F7
MAQKPKPSRFRPSRRSSFARRDSNLALLGALFAGIVLAFALLLLLAQRVNPELGSRLRGATADALTPLISIARAPVEAGRRLGDVVRDHFGVVERNRRLRAELQAANRKAGQADLLAAEVERLEALISLKRPERRVVASAIASANSASAGQRAAILSAGLSDGVQPRMPVIAAGGLAGRVTDVGATAARMMLLTDGNSRVPVKVLRTGWTGLAVGNGGTLLEFQYDVASGSDSIRVGDRLVTSGDGGLYPPGVPVAVLIDTEANPPRARPLANPTGLGAVMVEAPWLPPPSFISAPQATAEPDLAVAPAAVAPLAAPGAGGAAA